MGQIGNLRSNTYHLVKIGPVDPEFSLLKSLFFFKLMQAEHNGGIARVHVCRVG